VHDEEGLDLGEELPLRLRELEVHVGGLHRATAAPAGCRI
jgi:hypothetical protein